MIPDFKSNCDSFIFSKSKTIPTYIKNLYDKHVIQSVYKISSTHTQITLGFIKQTGYVELYKRRYIDNNKPQENEFYITTEGKYHCVFHIYGYLIVNNKSLLIEDGQLYPGVYKDNNMVYSQYIPIYSDDELYLSNLFTSDDKFILNQILCNSSLYHKTQIKLLKYTPQLIYKSFAPNTDANPIVVTGGYIYMHMTSEEAVSLHSLDKIFSAHEKKYIKYNV